MAILLAAVACGVSFYLFVSIAAIAQLARGPLQPINAPGWAAFRKFALTFSLAVMVIAFLLGVRRMYRKTDED